MLDDLVRTIETLKERIRNHRDDLSANETRTRMALIDPLLTALGWDTSDPACVVPECTVGGGRADYGLRTPGRQPDAFIEAKKLGEDLQPHREQMTRYSNMAGVKYAGLTDGDRWELYEVFKQASLDERRILNISILSDPPHECALKLLLLWRPNLASGSPVPANEPGLGRGTPDKPEQPTGETVSVRPNQEIPILWKYKGQEYHGVLVQRDGGVRLSDGRTTRTPTGACIAALGRKLAINGWVAWRYHDEQQGKWLPISGLRSTSP